MSTKSSEEDIVKVDKAMLMWNPGTDEAAAIEHPAGWRAGSFKMSVGACMTSWKGLSKQEQALQLVLEAWQAVIRDRVDPEALHEALLEVKEYHHILAEDVPGVGEPVKRARLEYVVEWEDVRILHVRCPYCGEAHTHGGGSIDEDWRRFLGHRHSHCHNRGHKPNDGYVIVVEGAPPVVTSSEDFSDVVW